MNASSDIFHNRALDAALASPNLRLRVGEHVIDMGALRVVTQPDAARLTSKAAAVLVELVRNAGNTVTRDQLMESVWAGRVTTPDVLTQAIKELRRAFADDTRPARYIETIPRVGYRLVAAVSPIDVAAAPAVLATTNFLDGLFVPASNAEDIIGPAETGGQNSTRMQRHQFAWIAAGVLGIVIALAAAMFGLRTSTTARAPDVSARDIRVPDMGAKWHVTNLRAVTSAPGPERRAHVSPDGTRVVYVKSDPSTGFERLYVQSLDEQSRPVALTTNISGHEEMPTWSPDGTQIAFEQLDQHEVCTLFVVPSMGGNSKQVAPCGNFIVTYFDWTPDGKGLITSGELSSSSASVLALTVLDIASGKKTPLHYERSATDPDVEAHYSPDGNSIVFRRGLAPHSDLYLADVATGKVRQLTHLSTLIAGSTWTPDGRDILFAYAPEGHPGLYSINVASGQVRDLNVWPANAPNAATRSDSVVYAIPRTKMQLAQAEVADGLQQRILLAPSTGSDSSPELSSDGKHLAFVSTRTGSDQLWISASDGSDPRAITHYENASISDPAWSMDGKHVLISVHARGKVNLVLIDLASLRAHEVAKSQSLLLYGSFGPEPNSYFITRHTPDANREFVLLRDADSAEEHATVLASGIEYAQYDPVTRDVYYTKTSTPGLFRRPLAGGAEHFVTQRVDATNIAGWRIVDGRIWYVGAMMVRPVVIHEFDPTTGVDRVVVSVDAVADDNHFSVSPARDRIVFTPIGPEDIDVGAFDLTRNAAAN